MNCKKTILDSLYAAADAVYRDFNSKIISSVDKDKIIGVRTPKLRAMARDMLKSGVYKDFIQGLPHKYFEENQLHAFIISGFRDFDMAVHAVDEFLPYVDNWATCDQMSPKVFAKNTGKILPYVKKWIKSKHVYTVRFGVLALMRYFMDGGFDTKYADMVLDIKSDEYYVNMMRAWYFATAAAKHFDLVYPYFEKLDSWTRARAIQKAIESYRVTPEHKIKLKKLKGKKIMKFIDMLKARRSVYGLNKNLPVMESAVVDFVRGAVEYVPDAFNMKSQRAIVVMGEKHEKFWNAVYDELVKSTGGRFSRDKIDGFIAAYGTILYFYDTAAVEETRRAYPGYAENFHDWVMQSNGMLQFAIWTGFAGMNIGANLQHYNPVIDNMVHDMFDLPDAWTLVAQMPFGGIAEMPAPRLDSDIPGRVRVEG